MKMAGTERRERMEFVEDLGILFEKMGVPRMAGRIWGWLLVCDPPHQTAAELAEAVSASAGSISTMARLLVQFGLIERIGLPRRRSRFYRIKAGGFTQLLRAKMALTTEVRKMAERGLALLKDEPPEMRRRLEAYRDFYAFFEREFPDLIAKWNQESRRATS